MKKEEEHETLNKKEKKTKGNERKIKIKWM